MLRKADFLGKYGTFFYLSFPILIFFFGWLRLGIALPLSTLVIWGMWRYLASIEPTIHPVITINKGQVLGLVIVCFSWVFLSGIGGFANQDWDHHFRNALFWDLITKPWPVYYSFPPHYPIDALANHASALNYYLAFWLPAAWVGKEFGPQAANIALLAWSYLGILLIFYYLNRLFAFKYILFVSLLFMLWSGPDILGKLILQKHLVQPGEAIELYFVYFYTAFTMDLDNVFNQFIPVVLVTVWVLNYPTKLNLLPITLLLAYAPFPFIGLSLFYYIHYLLDRLVRGTPRAHLLASLFDQVSWSEVLATLGLVGVYAAFYKAHTSEVPINVFWTRYFVENPFRNFKTVVSYFITFFLEAGVFFGLIYWLSRRVFRTYAYQYWISFGVLLFIPIIVIGEFNDFASRGSIPCLVILCVLTIRALLDWYTRPGNRSLLSMTVVMATLLLSWITPYRMIEKSLPVSGNPTLREAIGTFANPKARIGHDEEHILSSLPNFYSHEPHHHFFYQYMARR